MHLRQPVIKTQANPKVSMETVKTELLFWEHTLNQLSTPELPPRSTRPLVGPVPAARDLG